MPSGEEQPLLSPRSDHDNFSNAPRSPIAQPSFRDNKDDVMHQVSRGNSLSSHSDRQAQQNGRNWRQHVSHDHNDNGNSNNQRNEQDDPPALIDGEPLPPAAFYKMIGMRPPPDQQMISATALEAGSGLYHDISHNHRRLKRAYRLFETIIYLALLVQTLLSTIFIVLGSVKGDYHVWIAVLGAVSAVIAGVLALTKGTGMPNRIRMERDAVWEVRRMCEALYWQVNAGRRAHYEDVEGIWKRFMDIKRNAAKNHPDTWNASRTFSSSSSGSNSLR